MTTNAGGEEEERHRRGSIPSATAAGGKTSTKHTGMRWEGPLDGMQADADMCKSVRVSVWKNAIKRRWTSSQLLTSECSCQNYHRRPGRKCTGRRSTSRRCPGRTLGVWTGGGLSLIASITLFCVSFYSCPLNLFLLLTEDDGKRVGAPPCCRLSLWWRGCFRLYHTLIRVNTVWIKQTNNLRKNTLNILSKAPTNTLTALISNEDHLTYSEIRPRIILVIIIRHVDRLITA